MRLSWLAVSTVILAMAGAQGPYINSTADITASSGESWGRLLPGTPVQQDGEAVLIKGFIAAGSDELVFPEPEVRIPLAELEPAGVAALQKGETTQDQYGNSWTAVTIKGTVDQAALSESSEQIWQEASELYAANCSNCHSLHEPTEFTPNQWPNVLQTMVGYTALTPDQVNVVQRYLQFTSWQEGK